LSTLSNKSFGEETGNTFVYEILQGLTMDIPSIWFTASGHGVLGLVGHHLTTSKSVTEELLFQSMQGPWYIGHNDF